MHLVKHLPLFLLSLALASMGCRSEATGSAQFAVSVGQGLSAASVTRVTVTSSGPDIPAITTELVSTRGVWGGVIGNLPAGSNREFLAQAFDASNTLLFEGTSSGVTISANSTTLVVITLQEVNAPPPFTNEAPVIQSVIATPTTVQVGNGVLLQAMAADPNGDALSYRWTATAGVFSSDASPAVIWTAPATPGLITLTLTVSDTQGASSSLSFELNVVNGLQEGNALLDVRFNTWPRVTALSIPDAHLEVGQTTSVAVTATDADNDNLSFQWTASCPGVWAQDTSPIASFTPSSLPTEACNNCQLTVSVSDGRGGQTTGSVALCVASSTPQPFPPTIIRSYQSSLTSQPSESLTFEVTASDPRGSALTFLWKTGAGSLGVPQTGATVSRVVWTAPACVESNPVSIVADVTNSYGETSTRTFAVTGLPECGAWVSTSSMLSPRLNHTATVLSDGKVLVVGGYGYFAQPVPAAEVYDPATDTWSATGPMATQHELHSALLLPNGKVFVTAGYNTLDNEVYDPATGSWSVTSPRISPSSAPKAVLLNNGKVLVVAGRYTAAAEVYDPATDSWSAAGSLAQARYAHTATVLLNGKVLVVGGTSLAGWTLATAELYDPNTDSWSATGSLSIPRSGHTATLLPSGKVLVTSGDTAEVYDPATGTWSSAGTMSTARSEHTAALLPNGKVLVAGGINGVTRLSSAEVYDPATGTWSSAGAMAYARYYVVATSLPNGKVLITGGAWYTALATTELYIP